MGHAGHHPPHLGHHVPGCSCSLPKCCCLLSSLFRRSDSSQDRILPRSCCSSSCLPAAPSIPGTFSVCSASVCTTTVCPTSVCSTSACPTSVCSTSVCPTSVCPVPVCPASVSAIFTISGIETFNNLNIFLYYLY